MGASTTFSPRGEDREMDLSPCEFGLYSWATEMRPWHVSHTESPPRSLSLAMEVAKQSQLNLMSGLGGSGQPAALTRHGCSEESWRQGRKRAPDATHRLGAGRRCVQGTRHTKARRGGGRARCRVLCTQPPRPQVCLDPFRLLACFLPRLFLGMNCLIPEGGNEGRGKQGGEF